MRTKTGSVHQTRWSWMVSTVRKGRPRSAREGDRKGAKTGQAKLLVAAADQRPKPSRRK